MAGTIVVVVVVDDEDFVVVDDEDVGVVDDEDVGVVDDEDVVIVDDEDVVAVDDEDVFVVVLQQGCYLELAEDWMGCNGYTMKAQWAAQVRPIRNNEKNEKITRIDMLQ